MKSWNKQSQSLIPIGKVKRAHGLKGGIVIAAERREDLDLSVVTVGNNIHNVIESSWMPKGLLLRLETITSLEMAEPLVGETLFIDRSQLPENAKDEFLVEDLVGVQVSDETLGSVGVVIGVEPGSAVSSDRWWVKTHDGVEVAIPAVGRYIKQVDLPKRKIHVIDFSDLRAP